MVFQCFSTKLKYGTQTRIQSSVPNTAFRPGVVATVPSRAGCCSLASGGLIFASSLVSFGNNEARRTRRCDYTILSQTIIARFPSMTQGASVQREAFHLPGGASAS